jgi:hypothetical protein
VGVTPFAHSPKQKRRRHEDYKFKSDVDAAVRFFHENDLAGCGWVMKCSEGSTEVEVTLDCNKTLTDLQAVAASNPAYSEIAATIDFAAAP